MADKTFTVPPGHIVCTTYGSVRGEMMAAWGDSRALFAQNGLHHVKWAIVPGGLVDKARNESVLQMLSDKDAQWLMFIDGDMIWQPQAPLQLIERAYNSFPAADIIGGWCPLRGWPYLPTIDPGSGTWEPVAPGSGLVEVMRTGAAFVLIKRHVFEKMAPPWYHVNFSPKALDVLTAVETYALTKFDGVNPFRAMPEWGMLEKCAIEDSIAAGPKVLYPWNHLGEDSNFVDKARALGFRAFVDTDIVVKHVDVQILGPEEHLEAMAELREKEAQAAGVLSE